MKAHITSALLVCSALWLTACGGETDDPIRFEYTAPEPVVCAQTDIGFHPGSAELSRAAEGILYDTIDQMGGDCEDAKIAITAWRDDAGDDIAAERLEAIQTSIHASYGLPYSMMTTSTEDAPSEDKAGRVAVALMIVDES